DHFLSLCPTKLTVDLLEERLAAAEKSILALGASRGDRRTPFFEGCSPVPLLPSVASAAAFDLVGTEEVGAASAPSGRCHNSKGKGSKGGGGDGGGGGGGGGGGRGGGGGGGGGAASGGFGGGSGGGGGSGEGGGGIGSGGGGSGSGGGGGGGGGVGRSAAAQRGGFGGSQRQQQPRSRETPSAQQLREWYAGRGRSGGAGPCTYILRTGSRRGETQNVDIFDLDFDAILAMYALTDSAEGDCYLSVPPDPGIEVVVLGASASAAPGTGESTAPGARESALSGTAPTEALHTFTLDSGASRSFFRDSTTLTLLSRPVAVSLANPSGGPVLAHSSTVLPCPAAPSGLLSGLHLPSFSTNLPHRPSACPASAATASTAATTSMASPTVLTFDAEGHAVNFDVRVNDLQLFLQCDSRDGVSLFYHTSGATADSMVRSQWTTRDAVARLAVRSHLPPAERTHFGQYKTARSLYDPVVARYSSPATAALSRLMLPCLFADLAAFATVTDLIAHLRTSDARHRAALPT
ncbi:unnamed protein product, partial [Closterium sp. NIES-53]